MTDKMQLLLCSNKRRCIQKSTILLKHYLVVYHVILISWTKYFLLTGRFCNTVGTVAQFGKLHSSQRIHITY